MARTSFSPSSHAAPRVSRLAFSVAGVVAAAGLGCSGDGVPDEGVGVVSQPATVCVTIKRTPATPTSVADAYVSTAASTTNYGAATTVKTSSAEVSLLSFSLASIPVGATITQAQLRLVEPLSYTGNLAVHRITAAWSEGTVTQASFANAFVSPPVTTKANPVGASTLSIPITSLVSQWVTGAQPNYGLALRQLSGNAEFGSSENANGALRPSLYVCYDTGTCSDGVLNQGETGVDCGGPCAPCATCSDGVMNQGETGIDCGGPCGACPTLGRAPYVQNVTSTSAVLVWTTAAGSSSLVHYGTALGQLNQTASVPASVTQHEVTLTGLSPDTRYYYDVGSANGVLAGGDASHSVTTAPVSGSKGKLRAWIVGDSGTGDAQQALVRDQMLAFMGGTGPDLFLHMGDMAYVAGTTTEFTNNFFTPYAAILRHVPVWPTLGNHEGTNSDSGTQTGPYYTAYVTPKAGEAGGVPSGTEAYYSFDWANVHFVVLDSHDSPRTPGGAMLTWLALDLASTNQDWLIAMWHHPPYSKGSHDSDAEAPLIEMRQNALPILEAAGVDLVLGGHSHIYERSYLLDGAYDTPTTIGAHLVDGGDGKPLGTGPYVKQSGLNGHDGAVYVVAGHGGTAPGGVGNHPVMYFSELQNGSCVLDVQDNRLSLVNVRADGVLSDRFSMVKGAGLVLAQPDGGEVLNAGSTYDVKWATVGSTANVTLEYSVDDGQSWLPIATVANTGSYTWTVPSAATSTALLRISDAATPLVLDESNGAFTLVPTSQVIAVPLGSVWKYYDAVVDPGATWSTVGFSDASWASGTAELGYGDGDEVTTLFKASPVQPSYYFRKVFSVAGTVLGADLTVRHDDGYAVWINGTLVASEYMNNGTTHAAWASAASAENELSTTTLSLAPSPFVSGNNTIAVMVKQANVNSSDVSFDSSLVLTVGP